MVLRPIDPTHEEAAVDGKRTVGKSAVLHRDLGYDFLPLAGGEGNHLLLGDGRRIFDGSGGAAVGCIGWGNERVARAVMRQMMAIPYCSTVFYTTKAQEDICRYLVDSTNGHMSRAYIVNSGESEVDYNFCSLLTSTRFRSDGGSRQARQAIFS